MAILDHPDLWKYSFLGLVVRAEWKEGIPASNGVVHLHKKFRVFCKYAVNDAGQEKRDLIRMVIVAEETQIDIADVNLQRTPVEQGEGDIFSEVVP